MEVYINFSQKRHWQINNGKLTEQKIIHDFAIVFRGNLGPLYTWSKGQKTLGPTLSIFGLQIDPKLLINAGTLAPRVASWSPKFYGLLFFEPRGQYKPI
jgi:hypothetical protein